MPSGSAEIRLRASASMSSSDLRSETMNASRPTSSTRASTRSLIRSAEYSLTFRSWYCSFGSRTEFCRKVSRSRRITPRSTILNGLIRMPSS